MNDIIDTLKKNAKAAGISGYYSWRDAMLISAKEIEWLRQELDAANAAHDFVSEFAKDKLKEFSI